MSLQLTPVVALELTRRWHDQSLDLQDLKFAHADEVCVFTVLEERPDTGGEQKRVLRRKALQRSRVTVANVTQVQALGCEGEVELYINEVEGSPTTLRVKCVNGTLELRGEGLSVNVEAISPEDAGQSETTLTTPIGDLSWRRSLPKEHI